MPVSVISKTIFGQLDGSEETIGTKQGSQKLFDTGQDSEWMQNKKV